MTDLEKRADEYADERARAYNMPKCSFVISLLKVAYKTGATEETKELEAQIGKMKCCENCGWYYLQQHWRESKEINESRMFHCGTCGNKRNWKLKEIKENAD